MIVDKFPDNEIKRRSKDMNPDNKTNQISMLKYNKDFTISTANTRTTKKWKNSSTTVAEFVKILSEPIITKESYDEYMLLPKDEQDQLKDQGAYVLGSLKNGLRRRDCVSNRSGNKG